LTPADRIAELERAFDELLKKATIIERERNNAWSDRNTEKARADKAEVDLSAARSEVARLSSEMSNEIELRTKAEAGAGTGARGGSSTTRRNRCSR
jgi:hypothetical protein